MLNLISTVNNNLDSQLEKDYKKMGTQFYKDSDLKTKLCSLLLCCLLTVQNVRAEDELTINFQDATTGNPAESTSETAETTASPNEITSTQDFSLDLYEHEASLHFLLFCPLCVFAQNSKAVKENQPPNFILSPLSVRNALAMLSLGATGETAEEIQKVLQLPVRARELISRQSKLISSLKAISSLDSGGKLVTGDGAFVSSNIRVKQQFKSRVAGLGGEINRASFSNSQAAAAKINSWVQNKTEGKIDKIVESLDLNDETSLLVLNAIYFKGSWEHKFYNSSTQKKPFFINASCSVNVEMMTQKNRFQLADLEDAKAQVILLPYQGERLSMMIYLPKENEETSIDSLENWLKDKSPFDIQREHLNKDELSTVSVSLPKFKIRSSLNLNEPLKFLGLGKMFDSATADFSGMFSGSRNLFVSKVLQETLIEVDEEGTEAAAVTGSELAATSFSSPPHFTANRPFRFQIVDNETKTVLFSGRVKNPLEGTDPSESKTEEGNLRCIGRKSKVEEIFLDFVNLLAPNETESSLNNLTSRASRLQVLVDKYGNKTAGATEFIQRMNSTLNKLDEKERDVKEKAQRIAELPAAASGYFSGTRHPWSWNYSAAANGSCFSFDRSIFSVYIKGSSCVALYQAANCTQQKFQMDTTNLTSFPEVEIPFKIAKTAKSIGVCSSY